ncbi:hypothetical protein [uncultured Dysosmobacter sp.]|uniref:defense against restriction DarA-related protein n=1 Tax=uncultured Dysosmobacter sp. TaxID=2591384 RepID=UPI0026102265|nr:hypothetical protein [uncultured Dysosmobacter sp.]
MYRYYSVMRPIAPGTFPRTQTVKEVVNFDSRRYIPEISREAWGYIDYVGPLTERQAADYELVSPAVEYRNPEVGHIVQILVDRDGVSEREAQQMVDACRQRLLSEAVPSGDSDLAEEILSEELGLELDYLMDLLF